MSTNRFTPLPQEVIAREDLTPRAKFLAWCWLQAPSGLNQAEACQRLGIGKDALSRALSGGRVGIDTIRTLGEATGLWEWRFVHRDLRERARAARQLSEALAAFCDDATGGAP